MFDHDPEGSYGNRPPHTKIPQLHLPRRTLKAAGCVGLIVIFCMMVSIVVVLPLETTTPLCADATSTCLRTWTDAAYWTLTTMSTTGYGDLVPKTGVGRAWAVVLMATGPLLAGLLTGLLAEAVLRR